MATGIPCRRTRRAAKWVTGAAPPKGPDGPCGERLPCVRDDEGLDAFAGVQCPPRNPDCIGRPNRTSAGRFRSLLGYREGLASEPATGLRRAESEIIWWLVDSFLQRGARGLLDATDP